MFDAVIASTFQLTIWGEGRGASCVAVSESVISKSKFAWAGKGFAIVLQEREIAIVAMTANVRAARSISGFST